MRLTVFGATGGTGMQLVRQALAADHGVVAVVRDPARLPVESHPSLRVVRADVMDPAAIVPALADSDAVVSALGSRTGRAPTTVCTDGSRSIVQAMGKTDVRRLVVVSASGPFVEGDGPLMRRVAKPILQRVLRHTFADLLGMEQEVRGSDLDWTVIRPPMLTDGAHTGRYRTVVGRNVRGGTRISRADLAECIRVLLDDSASIRAAVSIAY